VKLEQACRERKRVPRSSHLSGSWPNNGYCNSMRAEDYYEGLCQAAVLRPSRFMLPGFAVSLFKNMKLSWQTSGFIKSVKHMYHTPWIAAAITFHVDPFRECPGAWLAVGHLRPYNFPVDNLGWWSLIGCQSDPNKNNSNCKKNFSKIILLIFFMIFWNGIEITFPLMPKFTRSKFKLWVYSTIVPSKY